MKQIVMFVQQLCPYCKQALAWQRELIAEYPELAANEIKIVDERKEKAYADSFDYYYVPTYYIDGKKVHEGAATKEKIEKVLRMGIEK